MWSIPTTHPTTVPHSSCIIVVAKPVGSHNHRQNNPSSENFSSKIFQQPLLRPVDTPTRSLEPKLPTGAKISGIRSLMRLHTLSMSLTCRRVRARGSFPNRRTSPPESPATNLQAYVPGFLIQHLHHPLLSIFLSDSIYFKILFYFSDSITSVTLYCHSVHAL